MRPSLLFILALIWFVGTCFRIYRHARYYQIEEYMSLRYIRWLLRQPEYLVPRRAIIVWVVGAAIGLLLGEAPGSLLPIVIAIIAAAIAVIPPPEGEIKRAFVRTQRATRMLIAAGVIAAVVTVSLQVLRGNLVQVEIIAFENILVGFIGLLVFVLAPVWLMLGNLVMQPVEAFIRRRFLAQARDVLDIIQPTIIGITGSYGKTTTKNFLRDILNARYKTYATPKSFNTLMGVSLAINRDLADDYSVEYFISEMGAYVPGEIERICKLTPPRVGVMIEVGPQHLERFGSLENTSRAKYELIQQLPPDGLGVFNIDNPYIQDMYDRGYPQHRIAVSKQLPFDTPPEIARLIATNISESLDGLRFTVTDTQTNLQEQFTTPILGEHNVTNLLLATAVAIHEGMSLREVATRVRTLQPAESRLVRQTTPSGITILNDAYSANPVGIIGSLKVLGMHASGKRLLITPGMIELGELQEEENHKLGTLAAEYATHIILVVEQQTQAVQTGVKETAFPAENLMIVDELSDAVTWYQRNLQQGDTVLFLNDLPDTY